MADNLDVIKQMVELAHDLQREGKIDEAGQICSRLIAGLPNPQLPIERAAKADAFNFLAALASQRNQVGTALDFFHQAITLSVTAEHSTLYRMNLTRLLLQCGWRARAETEVDRLLRIAPQNQRSLAHRLKSLVERDCNRGETAREHLEKALQCASDEDAEAVLLEYAAILADTAQLDEAKEIYQKAADTSEKYKAEGFQGVGLCLMRQMRCREAIECFNQALAIDPDMNMARWNRALSRLTIGDFGGWEDHEARFVLGDQMPGVAAPAKRFPKAQWDGRSADEIGSQRIHLHSEMGHGDTLQFCRYALLARDMGHDVRLETSFELVDLLSYSLPGVAVMPQADDWPGAWGLPEFDLHVPVMSLPTVFKTTLDTIPSEPYLKAHPDAVAVWRERLKDLPRPLVGVCWHGRSRDALWVSELDRRRSVPFDLITELFDSFPHVRFIALQNDGNEQHGGLLRVDEHLKSFADTAALIANLDLVISVDTAVTHVSAGMGKRTWMLDRADHCWRWHEPCGDKSPWYPSMKIYRQKTAGDWPEVLERVSRDLEEEAWPF